MTVSFRPKVVAKKLWWWSNPLCHPIHISEVANNGEMVWHVWEQMCSISLWSIRGKLQSRQKTKEML